MKEIKEVKDRGYYNKEDFKKIRDLRRDQEDTINRYEEIITFLESVYAVKGTKQMNEMEYIVKNFQETTERRNTMRHKLKGANDAVETARNAAAAERSTEYSSSSLSMSHFD